MITELCLEVINSFQELRQALDATCEHITTLDCDLPAWCQPSAKLHNIGNNYRQQTCEFLQQLEYLDSQLPREILISAGIMAGSAETIETLYALNNAKDQFKAAMLQLKAAKISPSHELLAEKFETLLPQRDQQLADKLARMGLARLHLKQCYRRIPILTRRPRKVSWTWANTRAIKKITVQDADKMLAKNAADPGIERQLNLLQGLDPKENLAIVQELAPHLRANIVLHDGSRVMVKGPVPIFYLTEDNLGLPEYTPPGDKKGKNKDRVIRKDLKINPTPFLPAIRAHRYLTAETV